MSYERIGARESRTKIRTQHIKKSSGNLFQNRQEIYEFMIEYANEFPVEKMSQMLEVSTSAYYEWKNKGQKSSKHEELDLKIKFVFESSRSTYGSPRVFEELSKQSIQSSKSTVARRMKALSITPKKKKKFKEK